MLVTDAPSVGKSALLDEAAEAARAADVCPTGVGVEFEADVVLYDRRG